MRSESKITARYAETDQMGIIHHSVYPVWYEVARTDFIKKAGMTYTEMEKQGLMLPLIELGCRYIYPAKYEDELTIECYIEEFKASKIKFAYEVYSKDRVLLNRGFTTHAWTNLDLKPLNMKKHFPEIYDLVLNSMEETDE